MASDAAFAPMAAIHRAVSPDPPEHYPVFFRKVLDLWADHEIPIETLAAIRCPALVMAGDRDLIRPEHTLALWRAIPGAQLAIVPGATHDLLAEKPDLCNRLILDFLANSS